MLEHGKTAPDPYSRLHCRERFAACVAVPDAEVDLAGTALWLAAEDYLDLDPQIYLGRIESLAERVRSAWRRRPGAIAALDALISVLVEEEGFGGNAEDYYDPRNSFLNEVLDRRVGIPISLSVLWLEVARRAGIAVEGVNLPGHFVIRLLDRRGKPILVDPFCNGMRISAEECEERLRRTRGEDARLTSDDLAAASAKQILVRMLNNLRLIYVDAEEYGRALAAVDRIALIVGDTPQLHRDRGLLFARLQIYGKAWADLAAYLRSDEAAAPGGDAADTEMVALRAQFDRVRHLAAAPN